MKELVTYLNKRFARFNGGTLRIFGDWFGRPDDNFHQVKGFSFEDNILIVTFDQDEKLIVWNPRDVVIEHNRFVIGNADRVRWEWYRYGRQKLEENRFFLDCIRTEGGIKTESNMDWCSTVFSTSEREPAVQIE